MKKKSLIQLERAIVICFAILALAPVYAVAQSKEGGMQNLVTVISSPMGVVVQLDGEYKYVGRTPFIVPYAVVGRYELKASKSGYQSLRRVMTFTGDASQELELNLKIKTRLKALGRSMLIPGWGQFYADRKTAGTIFTIATATAAFMLLKTQYDYRDTSRKYENLLASSQLGGLSYDQQRQVLGTVQETWLEVGRKADRRDLNLYILAGLWMLNMIDAQVFFPNFGNEIRVYQHLSLNSTTIPDGLGLGLSYSFN